MGQVIKDNDHTIRYVCSNGCGSEFDPDNKKDLINGVVVYYLKRLNLEYKRLEQSGHIIDKKMMKYLEVYEIGREKL